MKLELKLKSIFNVTLKKAGQDRTGHQKIVKGQDRIRLSNISRTGYRT